MRHFATASLFALAVGTSAVPSLAQDTQSPGGFRLPTPTATPTPTDIQGPVDPDAPILTRPRDPTPTPTPRATATPTPTPAPQPTPAPSPRVVPPTRSGSLPPRFTPPSAITPEQRARITSEPTPFPETSTEVPSTDLPALPVETAPATAESAPSPAPADEGLPGWLMALGGLIVAGGIVAALWFRRRRSIEDAPAPAIEPPRPLGHPAPTPAAPPASALSPAPAGPSLLIEAQVKQLARSMRFATLSYQLRVTNRGAHPLENVTFGGDLVTAHARVPTQAQLADPAVALAPVRSIERLDPGESAEFTGELRLPVEEIRPIPHGKAVDYVPLLRVRAEATGMAPVARTFVVGLRQPGAQRLQPFRLDEMPQTYHAAGQTALD
jgi:hypothetical protein